jgi:acetyl esterase/lipase/lysophospholipase L1-like esterase
MKLKSVLVFAGCIYAFAAGAQELIPLYAGMPPGNLPVQDRESFSQTANGRPSLVNVTNPAIIVYPAVTPDPKHAAVIICPGGGYLRLTIEDGGHDVAKQLAQSGITAIVLKYRTWRDSAYRVYRDLPVQDYQQAMRLVKANSSKWQIDTSKIGVLGFSAGGHLAAMVSVTNNAFTPAFSLLAYPVISFTDSLVSKTLKSRATLLGSNISNADKEYYSPELHVSTVTPPAFLVHAEDDSTSMVNNSVQYYRALLQHKVSAEMLLYQKGGHGFASYNKAEEHNWIPSAIRWLSLNGFYKSSPAQAAVQPPPFWNDIVAFKKNDAAQMPPQQAILFTGSSSFTKWTDVNTYFPYRRIVNRAFGGSSLPDVIRYAYDAIIPYQPKQVVIYCGENDLAASENITPEEVLRRVKTLFSIIHENIPAARISYVSIKPSPVRAAIQARVKAANRLIRDFIAQQQNADFIDIYDAMLNKDGTMREELYLNDRLHMKPDGYAIWKKIMEPYLIK